MRGGASGFSWVWLATCLLGACTVEPVDLGGRSCPCVDGWVCVGGMCVQADGGVDAADAAPDAARDASTADADAADARADADGAAADTAVADVDAAPDDTACDDILSGAFFCDGFEDATTDAWDWVETNDEVVDLSTSPTYRGGVSLSSETSAPGGRAAVGKDFAPIDSGELWIRGYFYVPSTFALDSVSFFYAFEDADPYDGTSVGIGTDGAMQLYVAPSIVTSGEVAPLDRWFCLQARIVVDDVAGSVEAWVDGAPALSMTGIDTRPANPISSALLGLERAGSSQPTATVYSDELALGTSMLPCD